MSGITNPAEAYFKDGIWGWDGIVWRKLPLVWGYSDVYREALSNTNAAAGANYLTGALVPAGEVWVVTAAMSVNSVTACAWESIEIYDGSTSYDIAMKLNPGIAEPVLLTGSVILEEGDRLRAYFGTCVAGDDIYFFPTGYKMKIAE